MRRIPWGTIALASPLLISVCTIGGQALQSPQPEKSQRGRIPGIGGVVFKSANRDQMREWYSKHLGLADKGMVNYIVDDLDALLDRLKQEGVKIDGKRMNESYGRFAWIYDLDGNKIELRQPASSKP